MTRFEEDAFGETVEFAAKTVEGKADRDRGGRLRIQREMVLGDEVRGDEVDQTHERDQQRGHDGVDDRAIDHEVDVDQPLTQGSVDHADRHRDRDQLAERRLPGWARQINDDLRDEADEHARHDPLQTLPGGAVRTLIRQQ